jgi:Kef-type K+ transport system membrane component KefB
MVLGATVTNLARHHERAFHEIQSIEWPVMILFFVLIGASLEQVDWGKVWWITIVFMMVRTLSRVVGAWIGARHSRSPASIQYWMGWALLPQAGLANGMALMASNRFPDISDIIIPVTVISTVAFEIGGPLITRLSLERVGESARRS